MRKIGVTGGIGSGKTFVCHILEKLGYPVFYSDKEAKKLMNQNLNLVMKIKKLLGNEAYLNGKINKLVVAYKDRLTRFGYELIEDLIKKYSNGTIEIINKK